jgi:hypothetical protein
LADIGGEMKLFIFWNSLRRWSARL